MDFRFLRDPLAPFMIRRVETGMCKVLLLPIKYSSTRSITHHEFTAQIIKLFLPPIENCCFLPREITRLEVRWMPQHDFQGGFPQKMVLEEGNVASVLRLMLLRQGRDVIEVTFETDLEWNERVGF
jgi:hypothetical protein